MYWVASASERRPAGSIPWRGSWRSMRAVSLLSAPGVCQVSSVVDPLLPVPPEARTGSRLIVIGWAGSYGNVTEGASASGPGPGLGTHAAPPHPHHCDVHANPAESPI